MKNVMAILMAAALLAMCGCAAAETLRVQFFDVGKADAMLITTPKGYRILIDAATNKEGKKLAERLLKEGVKALDMVIITHYDKDHVGGADQILEKMDVGTVVMPIYDKESKQHTQFLEALSEYPPREIREMRTQELASYETDDGALMHITSAHETFYGSDEENDFSLAVRLSYGDTKFLFAGDAESARQLELLEEGDVACDVLKVPHHGRFEKSSPAFLMEASPKIAYITDDEEEPAEEALLAVLQEIGAQVYCAKDDGDVTVISDGATVWME